MFPLSVILSSAFLAGLFLLWRYLPDCRFRRLLSGRGLCIVCMASVAVMMAVEGTWGVPLHSCVPFLAASVLMMLSLGFSIPGAVRKRRRGIPALCSHIGLFLLISGAFWGAPDVTDAQMVAYKGRASDLAYSRDGKAVPLPFSIGLEKFSTEYYDDGTSPRQYRSLLDIDGHRLETSVNHPCRYKGYYIYQSDYERERGGYSVLKLVRDPWLPVVFLGMVFLAAGALCSLKSEWSPRSFLPAVIVVAVLFTGISVARINFGRLAPALRSWWFIPHLVMYMLAYSFLAISAVTGILSVCGFRTEKLRKLSLKFLGTASPLLLLGMLCGAVWAKAAWGNWWTWDPKECWAAVTWLVTVAGMHLPSGVLCRKAVFLAVILLSFLAVQITWYGVDKLPSAGTSMHTYR